ncbi:MAG: hypothetical protein V7L30_27780 [Nostoc sp.]
MKIINLKDAINRRLYKRLIIVETPIHRVSCLNRTVLGLQGGIIMYIFMQNWY